MRCENDTILFFDAAYGDYISDPDLPRSIYEIEGARECAIEFRSFSKNGGFTGVRCAFTVVPKTLMGQKADGEKVPLHPLWLRRSTTKFNGVSYPVQRAAEALYSEAGKKQVRDLVDGYMDERKNLARSGAELRLANMGRRARAVYLGASAARFEQLGRVRQNA